MERRAGAVDGLGVTRPGFWAGRRVLVTGHTGFKGAWLSLWLAREGAHVVGLSLPPESPDGAFAAFEPWSGVESHVADVREAAAVRRVVAGAAPEVVFHLAAQSLVRRGWADPAATYAVNVVGTAHVLDAVAHESQAGAVVVVTSDKVYANAGLGEPFTEDCPLGGADPYSASKAAAELVVRAWRNGGRGIPVATVRAGNVVGGGDVATDRLLADAWRALSQGRDLVLRHPGATRPWQFVLDPLNGYLRVAERLLTEPQACPPAVNFGPSPAACWAVERVAEQALAAWGAGRWVAGPSDRSAPEAHVLRLDASLARRELGWEARLDVDEAIEWTVEWWRAAASGRSLRKLALAQIESYEELLAC